MKQLMEIDSTALVKMSQAGCEDAYGQLVRLNQCWLRGWLRGKLRDWTAAYDLALVAFITALKKIRSYRSDLDEVSIFDVALSQKEIQNLKRLNKCAHKFLYQTVKREH